MTEQQDNKAKKPRLNLTTSQVAASALAACCASIVASYLGVAGTVIGAAVGSVVATTGAAVYGHLFRTGGDKIKQTLLVNGQEVEVEVDRGDMVNEAAVPAGRFYGAQANAATQTAGLWHAKTPTGETQVITAESEEPAKTKADASSIGSRIVRIKKYRKPMSIAAAIIAVFCISIVVGVIAGAPVRSAGSSPAPATVTTTTTVTGTGHTQGQSSKGSSASSSSSASPSSGSTSSATAPASGSATSSSSASSTASPTASPSTAATSTGQARAGATSTGSPTS